MKLTKKDISNIDRYLIKKGINYIDVRYELIDHLVSEYESIVNYPDLESFLRKRTAWCRKIVEEKIKSLHWGYQKSLFRRMLSFFRNPMLYAILVIWALSIFSIKSRYGTTVLNETMLYLLVVVIAIQILDVLYWRFWSGKKDKMLSISALFGIYGLPNIFLYPIGLLESQFESNPNFSIAYFSLGIFVNVVALLEIFFKRKVLLERYNFSKSTLK